jgi:hypothetical protein
MPKAKNNRKRLFRAALALADLTAEEWAYKHGVRSPVLSMVLRGVRDDAELVQKIDAFIDQHRDTYAALAS